MNALQIARESLARQSDSEGAKNTAVCYREGRYDEGGLMPAVLRGVELALEQKGFSRDDITAAFELGYKACEKGQNIQQALLGLKEIVK
jgi:hypothetical protein